MDRRRPAQTGADRRKPAIFSTPGTDTDQRKKTKEKQNKNKNRKLKSNNKDLMRKKKKN